MEVADFEQDILKLAFETDVRITTASVAYYLGIPSTKAEPMLEELLERGVLELDSDREGNLYYRVADVARGDSDRISRLREERITGVDGEATAEGEGSTAAGADAWEAGSPGGATVDELDAEEPVAPTRRDGPLEAESDSPNRTVEAPSADTGAERTGSVGGGPVVEREESGADGSEPLRQGGRASERHRQEPRRAGHEERRKDERTTSGTGVVSRADQPFAGVTRERGAMDASLDTCGDERLVVQSEAQCEPHPFADSDPVVTSCSERPDAARQSPPRQTDSTGLIERRDDYSAVGHIREPQPAGANSGGSAAASLSYRRDQQLEKPEHQPGMSLLLSLILCGTGQIYNGEVSKGIMMMVLCFLLWFVLLGWVVHIWSIVDSVVVAERINRQSGNN